MKSPIDPQIHRRAKWRNQINTLLIMGGLTLLLAASAWALFGQLGVLWAVGMAVAVWIIAPQVSPEIILRLYRARPIQVAEAPDLHRVMTTLAARAELAVVPKLYYVPSANMNAFAVGRPERSAITVTDGLIRGLNPRQLIGVLAHEVSHIASNDLRVMGLADMVGRLTGAMQTAGFLLLFLGLWQGANVLLAAFILMVAPTFGVFLQLALSRSREYDADLSAAALTGDPEGLASALQTLQRKQGGVWESIFLPGGRTPDPSWLRTHPRTEDRIARLMELKPQFEQVFEQPKSALFPESRYSRIVRPPRYHLSGFWY